MLSLMSISWYECDIIAQIHHFTFCTLSVATIYGQGEIAESPGKVREFIFPDPVETLNSLFTTCGIHEITTEKNIILGHILVTKWVLLTLFIFI